MLFISFFALAVLGFAEIKASPLAAAPVYLQSNCNHDNLFRSFLDQRYTSSASAFCLTYVEPVVTSTRTVTPTQTTTRTTASTTSITQLFTQTDVISSTTTGISTQSTETDLLTQSTRTSTVVISTETDTSTLSTEFQTSTVETDYVTISTDTSYTVVQTDTVTITVPAVASVTVAPPKRRSPDGIEERYPAPAAVTSPLASSWIATYGASRVSSACKCIITKAASTSTVYTTQTASTETTTLTIRQFSSKTTSVTKTITSSTLQTIIVGVTSTTTKYVTASEEKDIATTETSYTTLTSVIPTTLFSSIVESLALPSTTTTSTTTTAALIAPPTATAFLIQASGTGTDVDGQYLYVYTAPGNAAFQFTSDITAATTYDLSTTPRIGSASSTFNNVLRIKSGTLASNVATNYISNSQSTTLTFFPGTYAFGLAGQNSRYPLQCTFNEGIYGVGPMSCSLMSGLGSLTLNQFMVIYGGTNPVGWYLWITGRPVNQPYTAVTLNAVPLY